MTRFVDVQVGKTSWKEMKEGIKTGCLRCKSQITNFKVNGWQPQKWTLITFLKIWFSSVEFSRSAMFNSLGPHGLQHSRLPCPSPTPRVHSDSCPSNWCSNPAILSSVVPFSCPQNLPVSESFPMSHLFAWVGQSIGVSALASFLPKKSQDWLLEC